jgi:hypothetical protein
MQDTLFAPLLPTDEEIAASSDQLLQQLLAGDGEERAVAASSAVNDHMLPPSSVGMDQNSGPDTGGSVQCSLTQPHLAGRQPVKIATADSALLSPEQVKGQHSPLKDHPPSHDHQNRQTQKRHHAPQPQQVVHTCERSQPLQPIRVPLTTSQCGLLSPDSSDDAAFDAALAAVLDAPQAAGDRAHSAGAAARKPTASRNRATQISPARQHHDSLAHRDDLSSRHPCQTEQSSLQHRQDARYATGAAVGKTFDLGQGSSGVFGDSDDDNEEAILAALFSAEQHPPHHQQQPQQQHQYHHQHQHQHQQQQQHHQQQRQHQQQHQQQQQQHHHQQQQQQCCYEVTISYAGSSAIVKCPSFVPSGWYDLGLKKFWDYLRVQHHYQQTKTSAKAMRLSRPLPCKKLPLVRK